MNRHARTAWLLVLAVALVGLLVALRQPDTRQSIRIAGSTGGGGLSALAVGVFKVIYLELPQYRVTAPQGTGGSVEIARLVGSGRVEFGFSSEIAEAFEGLGQQWKDEPYEGLRTVYTFTYGTQQVITLASSGIRSFADMRGKRICVGSAGSGGASRAEQVLLPAHGLHRGRDYTISWLPYAAGMEALRDGSIDVMFISMSAPTPAVMELAATNEIFLVPLDESVAKRLSDGDSKLSVSEIPPDVYGSNQTNTEPAATLDVVVALATNLKVSDEVVYQVTRAHWEQIELFRQVSTTARQVRLETAFKALPAPLHPGAEKYYREIGVWPPRGATATEGG